MTTVALSTSSATESQGDVVIVGVATRDEQLQVAAGGEAVDAAFGGRLIASLHTVGCVGAAGEITRILSPTGVAAPLIMAVGMGPMDPGDDWSPEALRRAAASALRGAKKAIFALPSHRIEYVSALAIGVFLGSYEFTAYRTAAGAGPLETPLGEAVLSVRIYSKAAAAALSRAQVLSEEVNRCRDLVNEPPNTLTPSVLCAQAATSAKEHGLGIRVFDQQELADEGFGGITAVGQGAGNAPALVRINHKHPEATATLAYVGKGITYDSGGISLKPVGRNETMKCDMAGAAAVLSSVVAVARMDLPVNLVGWLALAENMPSGTAMRPGDVLRMYGGTTVEVINTDAEGRIVLADAMSRASEEGPDLLIDVATLTGEMMLALGPRCFGLMANSDDLRARVSRAADIAGEQHWPMPFLDEIREDMKSDIADIAHMGKRLGGGVAAGLFLREFVPQRIPWAHLDIAGPAFNERTPYGYTPKGGTGCAVRTLVQLAADIAANGL